MDHFVDLSERPFTPGSPAALGFFMPPEWTPRVGTIMAWPSNGNDIWQCWPNGLNRARMAFSNVAKAICEFEGVIMLANPDDVSDARRQCGPHVRVVAMPLDDSWTRDSGATFLSHPDGASAAVKWQFNAYGNKFNCDNDKKIADMMATLTKVHRFDAPIVMEGGSFHVDDQRTLITTDQCVMNPNRNPGLSRQEIAEFFADYLGVKRVIFLPHGLPDDWDTDGHVDNVAAYASPKNIVMLGERDSTDSNYHALQENLEVLRWISYAKRLDYEMHAIQQPPRVESAEPGRRLSASYLNYYPVGSRKMGVICPLLDNHETDAAAMQTLTALYPGRKIVGVPSMDIVKGGGGIHCIVQQGPALL